MRSRCPEPLWMTNRDSYARPATIDRDHDSRCTDAFGDAFRCARFLKMSSAVVTSQTIVEARLVQDSSILHDLQALEDLHRLVATQCFPRASMGIRFEP